MATTGGNALGGLLIGGRRLGFMRRLGVWPVSGPVLGVVAGLTFRLTFELTSRRA
jgi:hypothetical protein